MSASCWWQKKEIFVDLDCEVRLLANLKSGNKYRRHTQTNLLAGDSEEPDFIGESAMKSRLSLENRKQISWILTVTTNLGEMDEHRPRLQVSIKIRASGTVLAASPNREIFSLNTLARDHLNTEPTRPIITAFTSSSISLLLAALVRLISPDFIFSISRCKSKP
ncbi:hypothetical protein Dimus_034945 [Dionaea muscipula]